MGLQLLLPVLQQRLDAEVAAAQEARAQEAVAALIQEEAAEKVGAHEKPCPSLCEEPQGPCGNRAHGYGTVQ